MFFFATMKVETEFPQYRKMVNGKSWYEVLSATHMVEYQVLGEKALKHEVKATIMPERWAIRDVLDCAGNSWVIVSHPEFEAFLSSVTVVG
jgi:hypothetical protein